MRKLIFVLACALLASCAHTSSKAIDKFTLTFSRGSGWVNWRYDAIVNEKGELTVNEDGGQLKDVKRSDSFTIPQELTVELSQKLQKLKKINFNERYGFGDNKPTDLPVTYFKYTLADKADSTVIYVPEDGELPSELTQILEQLRTMVQTYDTKIDK